MADGYAVVRVLVNVITGDVKVSNTGLVYDDPVLADDNCTDANEVIDDGYYQVIALFKAKEREQ